MDNTVFIKQPASTEGFDTDAGNTIHTSWGKTQEATYTIALPKGV